MTAAPKTFELADDAQRGSHCGCSDLLACPWCKDTDFDEVGLKLHVINGHCDAFNALDVSLPVTRLANTDYPETISR